MVFAYYNCKPLIKVVPSNFVIHPAYDVFLYTFIISLTIITSLSTMGAAYKIILA